MVILAALAAYANSFSGAFLFDDGKYIVTNSRIRSVWPLAETLGGRRPLVDLTLAVNYAIDGFNVRGYHAFNLGFHILAGLTLFGVIRRTLQCEQFADRIGAVSSWLALVTALIWVIHPLQTQSVTYLVQRGESLMGLFYLLTLYCVIRGVDSPRARWWYAAGIVACPLGMGSKAVMLTAPLVVLLYDRTFVTGSFTETLRRRWGLYLGLSVSWGVLVVCGVARGVLSFSGKAATVGFAYKGITPLEYLATQFGVIAYYLRLSMWPEPLCLDHDWPVAQSVGDVAWPALVVVPLLAGTAWAFAQKSWLGFAGAWFFLILAPTSSFIPIKDPAFEHRMYLPLAAVVLVVVIAGYAGLGLLSVRASNRGTTIQSSRFRTAHSPFAIRFSLLAIVAAVVALSTYGTIRRNRDYHSVLGMWRDVLFKRPMNARAHVGVGHVLFNQGRIAEAQAAFMTAVRLKPYYASAHYNLGNTLGRQGKPDEAVKAYRKCLRLDPRHDMCHYNLGNTLKRMGRLDEAIAEYRQAVRVNPRHAEAHINMGITLRRQGLVEEGIREYHKALQINPRHDNAHYNLGVALRQKGMLNEAIAEFRQALQYNPNHAAARALLDAALAQPPPPSREGTGAEPARINR